MQMGQIHHVEYYVRDLESTSQFWGWLLKKLGYVEYQNWPGGMSWRHSSGTYLVFVQLVGEAVSISNSRFGSGLNHIAFNVVSEKFLHDLKQELIERDVCILNTSSSVLCFEDGNGFAIEVFSQNYSQE